MDPSKLVVSEAVSYDVKRHFVLINGKNAHEVTAWHGRTRISIVLFTAKEYNLAAFASTFPLTIVNNQRNELWLRRPRNAKECVGIRSIAVPTLLVVGKWLANPATATCTYMDTQQKTLFWIGFYN